MKNFIGPFLLVTILATPSLTWAKSSSNLHKACSKGKTSACYRAGFQKYKAKDFKRARKYWSFGCKKRNSRSCYALGKLAEKSNQQGNAQIYYQKSCNLGFKMACKKVADDSDDDRNGEKYDSSQIYSRASNPNDQNSFFGFEINFVSSIQSLQAATMSFGGSYTPLIRSLISWVDFSPRVGVHFSKDAVQGSFPIITFGLDIMLLPSRHMFIGPVGGYNLALAGSTIGAINFGASGGYLFRWRNSSQSVFRFLDRIFVRYTAVLYSVTTHEIFAGFGLAF